MIARHRRTRGFSLVELLFATALIGLMTLAASRLVFDVQREARQAAADEDTFRHRETGLMRLRGAAAHATAARLQDATVVLRVGGAESRWCVREGIVVRLADGDTRACDARSFSLSSRARGTLLHVVHEGGPDSAEVVLVGGSLR